MKRSGSFFLIALVLCAVAVALWWRVGDERAQLANASDPDRSPSAAAASEEAPVSGRGSAPVPSQDTPPPVEREDYAAQLRAASDYLEFARSLLPAARGGDHAAQFHVYRALDFCGDGYRAYFDRGRVRRTLDDAMRWAAARPPLDPEEIRLVYERCHTLMDSGAKDLGEKEAWLNLAAEGGYPRAQVRLAHELDVGHGDPPATESPELREKVRQLAGAALRSREPEVIWEMTELTRADDGVAWMVAACQRGMDCSSQSDYVKWLCGYDRNCQPYESLVDIIQRQQASEYPEIEARARWINGKIDAGDWEALGF